VQTTTATRSIRAAATAASARSDFRRGAGAWTSGSKRCQRYKDKVRDWEMWNSRWQQESHAEMVADLNIRTAEIIRRVIPEARIAGGVLCGPARFAEGWLKSVTSPASKTSSLGSSTTATRAIRPGPLRKRRELKTLFQQHAPGSSSGRARPARNRSSALAAP